MRSRKTLVLSISLVLLVVVALVVFFSQRGDDSPTGPDAEATAPATPSATASPGPTPTTGAPTPVPTTVPTTAAPEVPDVEVPEPTPDPTATAAPGGTVTVLITYADVSADRDVEVGAFAATVEDAGTCTLTLTRETVVHTRSVDAAPDVSTTGCGQLLIPSSELSSGTWTAVVDYQSAASHGQSSPREVVVP